MRHHPGGQEAGAGAGLQEKGSPIRSGQIGVITGERDDALHGGSPSFGNQVEALDQRSCYEANARCGDADRVRIAQDHATRDRIGDL
jgi:hypothetical protein